MADDDESWADARRAMAHDRRMRAEWTPATRTGQRVLLGAAALLALVAVAAVLVGRLADAGEASSSWRVASTTATFALIALAVGWLVWTRRLGLDVQGLLAPRIRRGVRRQVRGVDPVDLEHLDVVRAFAAERIRQRETQVVLFAWISVLTLDRVFAPNWWDWLVPPIAAAGLAVTVVLMVLARRDARRLADLQPASAPVVQR